MSDAAHSEERAEGRSSTTCSADLVLSAHIGQNARVFEQLMNLHVLNFTMEKTLHELKKWLRSMTQINFSLLVTEWILNKNKFHSC